MEQTIESTFLGTVKVSRNKVKRHVYPMLRVPESLGNVIGKHFQVFAVKNLLASLCNINMKMNT